MEKYKGIKKLTIKRENYVGKDCMVSFDFENEVIDWAEETFFYQKPKTIKHLTQEEGAGFLESLKQTNVLQWESRYYDLAKMDGEMWTVTIEDELSTRKSTGNTVHPPEWEKFCALVSEISGKEFK